MWGHIAGERIGVSFKILFILQLHMEFQLHPGFWARHWAWKDECDMVLAFQEIVTWWAKQILQCVGRLRGWGTMWTRKSTWLLDRGDLRCLKSKPIIRKKNKQLGGNIPGRENSLWGTWAKQNSQHHAKLVGFLPVSLAWSLSNHVTARPHCFLPKRRAPKNMWLIYGLYEIKKVQRFSIVPETRFAPNTYWQYLLLLMLL